MSNSKKAKRFQFWINVVLILITLSIVLPFILVFISSLTDENTLIRNGYSFFPEKFSFYAYSYIIRQGEKILRAYGITIFVTIVGTAANLAMSSLLAYPLSIKKLPYRRAITFFVFFTMLFNGGLVPSYILISNWLNLKDSIWALVLPGMAGAWHVLMFKTFFMSIPTALIESAKIDGAKEFKIFYKIVIPLAKPAFACIGLFLLLQAWNDWYNSLLYIEDETKVELQYLLISLMKNIEKLSNPDSMQALNGANQKLPTLNSRMAMCVVAAGPILVVFPFFQKYFVKGLTVGSVKG